MLEWCSQCLGLGLFGSNRVETLHQPLNSITNNLRLRRQVVSRLNAEENSEDEEFTDDEKNESTDEEEKTEYVVRCKGHPSHVMAVPSTVVVQVQPESAKIYRPDLNQYVRSTSHDTVSIASSFQSHARSISHSDISSDNLSSSNIDTISLQSSIHTVGSTKSLHSITSAQYDALLANLAETSSLPDCTEPSRKRPLIHLEYSRRRPMKFLSPEDAAKPPLQLSSPSLAGSKLNEFPPKTKSSLASKSLGNLFRENEPVEYAGEYTTEGNEKPVKLRSAVTMKAISVYESRVDTKNNPVWYSFGSLVLALRYLAEKKIMEVDIVQVTDIPADKEGSTIDFQVRVSPGHKNSWVKKVQPGPRHDTSFSAKTTVKVRKLINRSFVASAWVSSKKPWHQVALGHGVVPHLEAQELMSGEWRVFPLQLRDGSELQDHLGTALIALSCCERTYGQYTFTVDVMQVKNVKVQRFGEGALSSFKAKAEIWVKVYQMIEGYQKKYELPRTELARPAGYDESKGWEAIYKRSCSLALNFPKEKVNLSSILVQIHGRVRHNLTTKDALLGTVKLGPGELVGGEDQAMKSPWTNLSSATPQIGGENQIAKNVPGDPLDTRLTQWGQALRRKAKVEMWHRLQI